MTTLVPPGQKARLGFYFHIPFCPHICPYCDFIKTSSFTRQDISSYFALLKEQLIFFGDNIKAEQPSYLGNSITVYFGGGTPGLFSADYYAPLIEYLKTNFILEEVTLETNPYTSKLKQFEEYRKTGFNRITLGAQSLCPNTLAILGRKHTPEAILANIDWAQSAGFNNIQVDLIYGLKEHIRTLSVESEIEKIMEAGATGISAYFLTIEKRTLFADSKLACEINAEKEYTQVLSCLTRFGLAQIETSNFSKFPAKHNQLYWYGCPYIGIGTGAHGLLPSSAKNPYGVRYKIGEPNKTLAPGNDDLNYRNTESKGELFKIVYDSPRTKKEFLEEMIFTLLRTENGIPLDWLANNFDNPDFVSLLLQNKKIERAVKEEKIVLTRECLKLTAMEKIRNDAWALEIIMFLDKFI